MIYGEVRAIVYLLGDISIGLPLNCNDLIDGRRIRRFVVGDSIEGWSDAIKVLMKSYLGSKRSSKIKFDYSDVRPKGSRLVTSG